MIDYAVIGSGIGGSSMAAYLHECGFKTVLFEKESYLGGCSSTFTHKGYRYNSGATTLAGYQSGHIVKQFFDDIAFTPKLIANDPAITIIQQGKTTPRYRDLHQFLHVLEQNYPHHKHEAFWRMVYEIGETFYAMDGYTYRSRSSVKKLGSLLSYVPLFFRFGRYLFRNAEAFISDFYGGISDDYRDFLEAQVLIVAQAPLREINMLTAALSLGYTFNETHYPVGGFSQLFDEMLENRCDVKRSCEVQRIERQKEGYLIHTKEAVYHAKNVVLNATMYDSHKLFDDAAITAYYKKYAPLNNFQSSFMLYMSVKSDKAFAHHYQIIEPHPFTLTLSKALFVSFSDASDDDLAPKGYYSVTASIHTDFRWWEDDKVYKANKTKLETLLRQTICSRLGIANEEVVECFSATPRTFKRYINRSQLGGNALSMKNILPKLPGNETPFDGLYHVGDSVYAAQGWPGVMLGVKNLRAILHV